jgi:chromosome partitioning protein
MSYIISVANEKGGVAKTTTTLSLGGALAEMGKRVLVVDLDPQANLSLSLGIEPEQKVFSIINLYLDKKTAKQAIVKTQVDDLSLLPSNPDIRMAERLLPMHTDYHLIISALLKQVDADYDFVLMDCPPFLGAITLNALFSSNLLIVPTQAEYYSVFALKNMMALVRQVRSMGNRNLRYRLLLTMFDKRNGIHRSLAEHLRNTFATGVLDTVIEIDTRLRESPLTGLPIVYHAAKSRAALQYRFLAQEIFNYAKA